MNANILAETTTSLNDAARSFPGRHSGRQLGFSTIWRWVMKGVRGADGERVKLEAIRLGGRWVTSKEAITRFSSRLNQMPDFAAPAPNGLMKRGGGK